jgi:cytochrome b pre-mRNA-processing protein 3
MMMFKSLRMREMSASQPPGLACPARGLNMLAATGGASLGSAKDAMLDNLFRRLTAQPMRGAALFSAATAEARQPHWFRDGAVPDTIDGRFAMLSTVVALILVRLEQEGDGGNDVSVALTERFIAVLESEHRELGLGDPTLGKTVRKLVGSLARRTALWRVAVASADWREPSRESVYRSEPAEDTAKHTSGALKALWSRLERTELGALAEGKIE